MQEREQYPQPFSACVAFHGPKRIRSQWRVALCQFSSSDQNCLHRASVNTQANLSPSDVLCEGLLLHERPWKLKAQERAISGIFRKRDKRKNGMHPPDLPHSHYVRNCFDDSAKLPSCSKLFLHWFLFFFYNLDF